MNLASSAQGVVLASAALAAVLFIIRKLHQGITAAVEVKQTIEAVHAEFAPNHGGSMRDSLNRIEFRQEEFDKRITVIEEVLTNPGSAA